jgi:hypothetical protein
VPSARRQHAVEWALRQAAEGLASEFVLVNVQEPASLYEVVTAHDSAVIEQVRGAAAPTCCVRPKRAWNMPVSVSRARWPAACPST